MLSVPSLYVRVYRVNWITVQTLNSSLTVCEGVSADSYKQDWPMRFPHCMWGCIESGNALFFLYIVPSLYVRVYRGVQMDGQEKKSSLTVCEGVSCLSPSVCSFLLFPHCMWGCIAKYKAQKEVKKVPSLYVRVYRRLYVSHMRADGSLTVCEGVSN